MEDYVVPVFVEAKMEYTNQLVNILKSHVYEGFKSIYEESCGICNVKGNKHMRLKTYQTLMSQIPQWNQEIIESEYSRIMAAADCDWFDDLVTAVFLAHTKILTSIGNRKSVNSVNLNIPRSCNFVHKIYINVAREIWKNPYLFDHEISAHNFQRNIRDTELIIVEGIKDTVRRLLPVRDILKDYLSFKDEDEEEDADKDDKDKDDEEDEDKEDTKTKFNINKDEENSEENSEENTKLPEPEPDLENSNPFGASDIKEIPTLDQLQDTTDTTSSMSATDEGLPQAIAAAPSEGQADTSIDTSGSIPTVDTTIGGESHSELTDGDPTFQKTGTDGDNASTSIPTEEKNISFEQSGGDVNMSFDDGDSMDNFMSDAATLVEKNDPDEQVNIQKYLETKTEQAAGGEKVFTLFDDAADTDTTDL